MIESDFKPFIESLLRHPSLCQSVDLDSMVQDKWAESVLIKCRGIVLEVVHDGRDRELVIRLRSPVTGAYSAITKDARDTYDRTLQRFGLDRVRIRTPDEVATAVAFIDALFSELCTSEPS